MSPQSYFEGSEETQKEFAARANRIRIKARPVIQQQISNIINGGSVGHGATLRIVEASKRKRVRTKRAGRYRYQWITLRDLALNELNYS